MSDDILASLFHDLRLASVAKYQANHAVDNCRARLMAAEAAYGEAQHALRRAIVAIEQHALDESIPTAGDLQ